MPISMKVRDLMVPIGDYAVTTADKTLGEAVPTLRKLYCEVEWGKCTEAGHKQSWCWMRPGAWWVFWILRVSWRS